MTKMVPAAVKSDSDCHPPVHLPTGNSTMALNNFALHPELRPKNIYAPSSVSQYAVGKEKTMFGNGGGGRSGEW